MQFLDTDPLVIEFFPLLVVVPAAVVFIVMMAIRYWSLRTDDPSLSIRFIHLKRAAQLAIGLPYAVMILSVVIGMNFDTEGAVLLFHFGWTVVQVVISVFIGALAGFILAAVYAGMGVSGFMLGASLMSVIPLTVIDSAGPAVQLVLSMLGTFAVFPLFFSGCQDRIFLYMTGKVEFTEQAKSRAISSAAGFYVLEAVKALRARAETDGDPVARETLERVLRTDGRIGDFIHETVERVTPLFQSAVGGRTASSGTKQFMPRGVWTMTASRFRRRVLFNRSVSLFLAILLFLLVLTFASNLSTPLAQWGLTLVLGVLILSVPLAVLDPLLAGKRLDVERTVSAVLAPLRGTESNLILKTEASPRATSPVAEEGATGDTARPAESLLSPEFIEHQEPSLRTFLKAVEEGRNDVYREGVTPIFVGLAGGFMALMGFMLSILTTLPLPSAFEMTMIVLGCIGVLVMLTGAGWWYSLTRRTSFRGYRRSWLSAALSYLDAKESGIADVGLFLPVPRPPRQFAFLQSSGASASRGLFRRLQSITGQSSYPSVEREASEKQMAVMRPLVVLLPLSLIAPVAVAFYDLTMAALFMLLLVLTFVSLLYSYFEARKRLKQAMSTISKQTAVEPPEIVAQVLRLLREEYAYPLRFLTVRTHSELVYTGRVYLTSTEVRFREAVFIPSIHR